MISPIETQRRIRNVAVVYSPTEAETSDDETSLTGIATAKQWVADHPTFAVASCAIVGFVIGYLIKRR